MGNHSWRCLLQVSWWNIGSFGETAGYCWRENERLDMLQYAAPSTQNFKLVCAIYSASIPKIVYQLVKWCNRAHSDLVICTPNLSFWVKSPPRQLQCWNWLHWTPLTYCPRASTYSSCKCLHPNFDGFVRSSHRVKFLYCVVNLWIIKTLASTIFFTFIELTCNAAIILMHLRYKEIWQCLHSLVHIIIWSICCLQYKI